MAYDPHEDGVLLFGGGYISLQGGSRASCSNDTWLYRAADWHQLSVSGPPALCEAYMAYDAADGYTLLWGGLPSGVLPENLSGQTWKFADGQWTELPISGPPTNITNCVSWPTGALGSMVYDPALQKVVLEVEPCQTMTYGSPPIQPMTWEYSAGGWSQVNVTTPLSLSPMTFDPALGEVLSLREGGSLGRLNATAYTFDGTTWSRLVASPFEIYGPGFNGMAYDPRTGGVLVANDISTSAKLGPGPTNGTWYFINGTWTNITGVVGPAPAARQFNTLTFDEATGALLYFGGGSYGSSTQQPRNDTWILSLPPMAVNITTSATPHRLCSRASPGCGLGTDKTRISIGVRVGAVPANPEWGVDSGSGSVEYGPTYWMNAPLVTFLGWQNLTPAPVLNATVSCFRADGQPPTCGDMPTTTQSSAGPVLNWSWDPNATGLADQLVPGDSWNLSFDAIALGPPFGDVPVDSCITTACSLAGSGSVNGVYSHLGFGPPGGYLPTNDSLPLATVEVVPAKPLSSSSPPVVSPPPAPTGSFGANPTPVSQPVSTPVPQPVLTPVTVVGLAATGAISGSAATLGIIAGGATRAVVGRRLGQQVALLVGVRQRGNTRPQPVRGAD